METVPHFSPNYQGYSTRKSPEGTFRGDGYYSNIYSVSTDTRAKQCRARAITPYTACGKGLRLPDIRGTACALTLARCLTLGRSVDHIREFFVRAFKERAQLRQTFLVLERAPTGDSEEPGYLRGLST